MFAFAVFIVTDIDVDGPTGMVREHVKSNLSMTSYMIDKTGYL